MNIILINFIFEITKYFIYYLKVLILDLNSFIVELIFLLLKFIV